MAARASLNRNQGRVGWTVQFRHPALIDPRTGRPGRRVRFGLGTRDDRQAQNLVAQLNDLLAEERWWTPAARAAASAQFDSRVVEIFYAGVDTPPLNARAIRDDLLPLPLREEGWKRILLLGTTGAGKTTVVRQLIGTDPDEERFPTTATGRTTIADTEIILGDGNFEAAVTFFQIDEVREYIIDCLLKAALAAHREEDRLEVQHAVLRHPDERFRFNYVLGDGMQHDRDGQPPSANDLFDQSILGLRTVTPTQGMPELGQLADDEAPAVISSVVDRVSELAAEHGARLTKELDPERTEDPRVLEELLEQGLEEVLRDDDSLHGLVDALLDQMTARFDLVKAGELRRNRQGWAESWTFETSDRTDFIRQLRRFTSNSKLGFGRLLTPLVNGVRVGAPFSPTWHIDAFPPLVLFDTEGLGHTPDSSSSIPTRLTRLVDEADAVVLVDNAEQPMQAAPTAVLRAIARSGHAAKLHLVFTHFDGVSGDNLPSDSDRARHVVQSCEGILRRIGEEFGPFAEHPLRERVKTASYFLADTQKLYKVDDSALVVQQLRRLLRNLEESGERPTLADTRPVYDKANLVVAIRDAVETFNSRWAAVLGRATWKDIQKEHWGRVKALSRRLAFRMDDEYLHLSPVADLQADMQGELVKLVQNPVRWTHGEPSEAEKQAVLEDFVARLNRQLLELCRRRMTDDCLREWQDAYSKNGKGSTSERARIIANDIYAKAAPIPRAIPSQNGNIFPHDVIGAVKNAAIELDIPLQ